nr:uncharacterized protein LOC110568257 isoform X2 [Aotus nancymaae]
MRDRRPLVHPWDWTECQRVPQPEAVLGRPSRGPFKRGRCFSLKGGTLPACVPYGSRDCASCEDPAGAAAWSEGEEAAARPEGEEAVARPEGEEAAARSEKFLRRSRGGFHVIVEEEAGLCGFSGFAHSAAPCQEKEELSARLAVVDGSDRDCRVPERRKFYQIL